MLEIQFYHGDEGLGIMPTDKATVIVERSVPANFSSFGLPHSYKTFLLCRLESGQILEVDESTVKVTKKRKTQKPKETL